MSRLSPPPEPAEELALDRVENTRDLQRLARLVIVMAVVAAAAYLYFLIDPTNRGTTWVWALAVAGEGLTIFQALGVWWTVMANTGHQVPAEVLDWRNRMLAGRDLPTIDVLITVAGEPLDVVRRTATAARGMRLPHETWVLDDGDSDRVRDLCVELGIGYLRRDEHVNAKAGNVNSALRRTSGKFVAIFDADFVPTRDFLVEALPYLVDKRMAFAQAPQWYTNRDRLVPLGAGESQRIFYELVCPGKNHFNAVFCVGTNVIFRREALAEIGGLYTGSNSEDIWTSLLLHRLGWRSVYVPKVLARGLAPDTLRGYFKQQFRWARGGFEVLLRGRLLRGAGLNGDQRLQYLFTGTNYLLSFATVIFQILPATFLLGGYAPVHTTISGWLLFYLPFYVLLLLVTYLQAGGFRIAAIVTSLGAAPVHVQAFFSALLGRKASWSATNAGGAVQSVELIVPQFALLTLNVTAIVAGVIALTPQNAVGTWLAIGWACLHVLVLGRVVVEAFLDARRQRRERAAAEQAVPYPEPDRQAEATGSRS